MENTLSTICHSIYYYVCFVLLCYYYHSSYACTLPLVLISVIKTLIHNESSLAHQTSNVSLKLVVLWSFILIQLNNAEI